MLKLLGVLNIIGAGIQFALALQGGQDYKYGIAILGLTLGLVLLNESNP